jgi:hypothetical protein
MTRRTNTISQRRVAATYPDGSRDFELIWSRVEAFTSQLRDPYGAPILDSPAAVAEAVDLPFIMSVDGRVHLEQFRETISMKRPRSVDKPFALSTEGAREIFRSALASDPRCLIREVRPSIDNSQTAWTWSARSIPTNAANCNAVVERSAGHLPCGWKAQGKRLCAANKSGALAG